ncbi:MAG: methyltransferase domain-containing protein [Polyangiaceae bacterium]|nr:methyltransferase domain-containing protein [Polyangiaceae bacterium]
MDSHASGHTDEHLEATRAYYDEFAARYEDKRGGRDPGGYHDLVDDLEIDFLRRFGTDRDVLEVGCGTGLLLERIARFARSAKGIDLSDGMLEKARARGLDVARGSATDLPFADASFDVACSFKVLPHVRDIDRALTEMSRVVRPGGTVVIELYNPYSLRGLVKNLLPAGAISDKTKENAVYTRFDSPFQVSAMVPRALRLRASRGIRIVTPAAIAMRLPVIGRVLDRAERALCDSPLRHFGGFWIAALEKA